MTVQDKVDLLGKKQPRIGLNQAHLVPDRLVTVTQRRILKVGAPGNEGIHRGAALQTMLSKLINGKSGEI